MDAIEKAEGPTPWVAPLVVVHKKGGDIRICVDMRRVNEDFVREQYPIPTIDEILEDMTGAEWFSKLDLKWGYHQIELELESQALTTFFTHTGLWRYKRLMFGISPAPEIYQHIIRQVLQDISDDIVVFGKNVQKHDTRLHQVLKSLQEKQLTLNKEKCVLRMTEMEFMGKNGEQSWSSTI